MRWGASRIFWDDKDQLPLIWGAWMSPVRPEWRGAMMLPFLAARVICMRGGWRCGEGRVVQVTGVTIHRGDVLVGSSTSSDERREKQPLLGDARDVHFGARGQHPVQGLCTNPRRSRASCLHENSVPDTSFWMQETRLWPPSVRKTTDRARYL